MNVQVPDVVEAHAANLDVLPLARHKIRRGLYRRGFKRLFDVSLTLLALPFVLPFGIVVSLLIMADGGPVFFRQERVGKDGRRFLMWKFRTMVPNAEELLERHLAANPMARLEWATKQKLDNDPRCTRLGRLLRRTSLDEIPQLINVLAGDMALVGPRPMLPEQQALYPGNAYYDLRPGMTGSWQVLARNDTAFSRRAHYDDLYDMTLSFGTDMSLLARTALVVLRGTGR